MTYGIRTGETVLITAQEKVGKTELMHFIEHKLLTETEENVGAIFLEEGPQRHLHALAGIQLGRPVHLPDTGISDDQILSAVAQVVRRDGRLHIYSYFGSDDPAVFLDTIRFLATARACKYVLLDHISMVVSGNSNNRDERKQFDWFSSRLEMLVKELDIALIIVSHVNDEGQTRGSRYMTKVFDITINARRDMMHADPIERNTIYLSVPYNRFCSRTGEAGGITFDEATYSFTPKVAANDNQELLRRDQELAA
jgi:twinkle protein